MQQAQLGTEVAFSSSPILHRACRDDQVCRFVPTTDDYRNFVSGTMTIKVRDVRGDSFPSIKSNWIREGKVTVQVKV